MEYFEILQKPSGEFLVMNNEGLDSLLGFPGFEISLMKSRLSLKRDRSNCSCSGVSSKSNECSSRGYFLYENKVPGDCKITST